MSLSPQLDPLPSSSADPRSPPSPSSSVNQTNAQLATLLSESCRETETLRRELSLTRKRAERAERLLAAFPSVSSPGSSTSTSPDAAATRALLMEYEDRVSRAEHARDEAEARKRAIMDNWTQLERYLAVVEIRAADARAGFGRIVTEGGGQLVLANIPQLPSVTPTLHQQQGTMAPPLHPSRHHIPSRGSNSSSSVNQRATVHTPAFPSLPLPPPPNPNPNPASRVRPRAGSLDGSGYLGGSVPGQPPNKKSRGERDDRRGREERAMFSESPFSPQSQHQQAMHSLTTRAKDTLDLELRHHPDLNAYLDHPQHPSHHHPQSQHPQQHSQQRGRHPSHLQPQLPRMINDKYSRHRGRSRSRSASRSRSRSSSHSSRSSLSVDEMLLQATTGDDRTNGPSPNGNGNPTNGNGNGATPPPPGQQQQQQPQPPHQIGTLRPSHGHHHRHRDHRPASTHSRSHQSHLDQNPYQQQHPHQQQPPQSHRFHPESPPPDYRTHTQPPPAPLPSQQQQQPHAASTSHRPSRNAHASQPSLAAGPEPGAGGPLPQPGQVQTYQTHVFAPVVTGAPVKKSKFAGSGGSAGSVGPGVGAAGSASGSSLALGANGAPLEGAAPPAPPQPSFPPTNAQGQRICRQCGLPGRYKDNKCVEKWGPGPQGPGTVCDRCRKKMKRVERRGTLDNQQLASSNQMATLALQQQQQAAMRDQQLREQQAQQQQQQQQQQQSHAHPRASHSQLIDRSIRHSDTLPSIGTHPGNAHQLGPGGTHLLAPPGSFAHRDREESALRSALSNSTAAAAAAAGTPKGTRGAPPSPPAIAILAGTADDGPGAGVGSRAHSRSNSRAGARRTKAASTPKRGVSPPTMGEVNGVVSKRSPLGSEGSGSGSAGKGGKRKRGSPTRMDVDEEEGEVDADADADPDVDAEAEAEVEGDGDGERDEDRAVEPDGDADADADAEAELLEAVDAAEANSNHSGGERPRFKSEDS